MRSYGRNPHRLLHGFIGSIFFSLFWAGVSMGLPLDPPRMTFRSAKHTDLITELTQKYRFDIQFLTPLFEKVVIRPEIIEKFERPVEMLSYYEYRNRFFRNGLVEKGQRYLEENRPLLEKVEAQWGVPKEVIAAILGVETRFGEPGVEIYLAWDVLNTAYALYPPREAFYRGELIAFLTLCREEGLDPLTIKSSYAGAIGVPQFIPTSFLKYAIDADGDKRRDLWTSPVDIYSSVANYLKQAGWKSGDPVRMPVKISGNPLEVQKIMEGGIQATIPVERAVTMGIEIPAGLKSNGDVSFVSYAPEEGRTLFLALFNNFRVIARYNFSVNYALLVAELSELIK